MLGRCLNSGTDGYDRYGGAGVTVCKRWLKFSNFLEDMNERPGGTSLGRLLDMGNYESGNAFWQTPKEQGLARRNKKALLAFAG